MNIWTGEPDLSEWRAITQALDNPKSSVKVGVVGKYVGVVDSYKSISESLAHAGIANQARVEIFYIDSDSIKDKDAASALGGFDGIIIPGGFGNRGIEGKIATIRYARKANVPFFGICLGMQLAAIEFARNELGLTAANSQEFDPTSADPIIHLMEKQRAVSQKGGTMRLGAYPCEIKSGTKALEAYGNSSISERHRHRYEFNNDYRQRFTDAGMTFSGISPDNSLVEVMELTNHAWFLGCQFHPELKSRPFKPHPLFREFTRACLAAKESKAARAFGEATP